MHLLYRLSSLWLISFIFFLVFSPSSVAQTSCTPSNCTAQCQPSCSEKQVCVLGTMSSCGQCPASKCMSKAALGIADDSDSSSTNDPNTGGSNNGLIGGLVGGLLGGGLLLGGVAFCLLKYRKKKMQSTLPTVFASSTIRRQQQQQQDRQTCSSNPYLGPPNRASLPMSEGTRDSSCHSITSGVIPIAYIPPSHHIQQQQQQLMSANANQSWATAVENPFKDPRHSQYSIDDDDDDDDMSSRHHSTISTAQIASHQAVQVTRAKPQILRVNTVRVNNLKRGDSVRTILTKSDEDGTLSRSNTLELSNAHEKQGNELSTTKRTASPSSSLSSSSSSVIKQVSKSQQDPFQDDRYTVDNDDVDETMTQRSSRPVTNHSLGSTMGDGEITIFWSGEPLSSTNRQY